MSDAIDRLANALRFHRSGDTVAASALYRDVLADDDRNPSALYRLGCLDLQAGRAAQAADLLARAAAVRPNDPAPLAALAGARLQTGDFAGAAAAAETTLRLQPGHPRAWFVLGTALAKLGHIAPALAALQKAVASDPDHADGWLNLGNALLETDDLTGAEAHCRAALVRAPGLAEAHASLGHMLCCQRRYRDAITACAAAIRLKPNFAEAHWNMGIASLLAGDFTTGWEKYEWRKRHPDFRHEFPGLATPEWQGERLDGHVLLVTAEQGLGDAIQFVRYVPLLQARGAEIVLACDPSLIPLFGSLVRCVDKAAAPPAHDLWVDQMSLPRLFGTRLETIPAAAGYLRSDPAKVAAWRRRLPPDRLIGLVWAGNPAHSNDRRRSLPPGAIARLTPPGGATFVALQLGPRQTEAHDIQGALDLSAGLTDYAETAAVLSCLDLLISVDTSVAHLAGALGRPTWLLLPYAADWRWLSDRDDSPWYDSLRLIRQERPGDWDGPLNAVARGLASCGWFPASPGK